MFVLFFFYLFVFVCFIVCLFFEGAFAVVFIVGRDMDTWIHVFHLPHYICLILVHVTIIIKSVCAGRLICKVCNVITRIYRAISNNSVFYDHGDFLISFFHYLPHTFVSTNMVNFTLT